jgi:uncharacterized tellurite resistance protein B-like protein
MEDEAGPAAGEVSRMSGVVPEFLKRLLGVATDQPDRGPGETESVRRIARELEKLPPERARFLAAFAFVLGRVAHSDLEISEAESQSMERIVERFGGVPGQQAVLVVEIAKSQNRLFGGTEGYLVTRELKKITEREERERVLDCLFEVSAADGSISASEENLIWQVASELGLTRADYTSVRARWSGKRAVLRDRIP